MQPSVLSSLAPGQWTLFKWQRFLMAQGQSGAWCKVGESGGSSESLLRQWQRFFCSILFCHRLRWGLQCNCVASAFQAGGGQFLWRSTEAHVTYSSWLVGVWAAGTFGRWEGFWSPALPLLCCSMGFAALSLDALVRAAPDIVAPMAEGSGYPLPALKQSCSCDETWGQVLHLLLVSCRRLRICRLPGAV